MMSPGPSSNRNESGPLRLVGGWPGAARWVSSRSRQLVGCRPGRHAPRSAGGAKFGVVRGPGDYAIIGRSQAYEAAFRSPQRNAPHISVTLRRLCSVGRRVSVPFRVWRPAVEAPCRANTTFEFQRS